MSSQHDFKPTTILNHPTEKLRYRLLPTSPVVRYCVQSDNGLYVENGSLSTALAMMDVMLSQWSGKSGNREILIDRIRGNTPENGYPKDRRER